MARESINFHNNREEPSTSYLYAPFLPREKQGVFNELSQNLGMIVDHLHTLPGSCYHMVETEEGAIKGSDPLIVIPEDVEGQIRRLRTEGEIVLRGESSLRIEHIPSAPAFESLLREWVRVITEHLESHNDFELVFGEKLTNAMWHGNEYRNDKYITIELMLDHAKKTITAKIMDEGDTLIKDIIRIQTHEDATQAEQLLSHERGDEITRGLAEEYNLAPHEVEEYAGIWRHVSTGATHQIPVSTPDARDKVVHADAETAISRNPDYKKIGTVVILHWPYEKPAAA
ncbi:MAG: ATP-binding protein [Patescibacteria group bacterium]|nr:ATP-binding protein [Patescibacteria group bacterium]MDE2437796.1 ATP-binding protein [Patescibacteria group bacterium]